MLNTVRENEICLTADEIRRRSISDSGVCIIGTGLLADALKATSESLAEDCANCCAPDQIPATCRKLWYILDIEQYNAAKLNAALDICASKQLELTVIILLSNIKCHPTVQQYAEMELIATHGRLAELRHTLTSAYRSGCAVKAVICDRLFSVDADCLDLCAVAKEAEDHGTITINRRLSVFRISVKRTYI